MKIQPIDSDVSDDLPFPETMKQMPKSRLKRLFERQFTIKNVSERIGDVEAPLSRGNSGDFEPSSVCLAKMVLNFMEDNNNGEKQRCGRSRCSCFTGSGTESSDDECDLPDGRRCSSGEACDILKGLVLCTSVRERNLLADVNKIVESSKSCKRKEEPCLRNVVNGLVSLGYDAGLCKSRWEKSPSCPAGEYEYVDVIYKEERFLIDIDFKSKFEIARATKTYKLMQQTLPYIFVGKEDRLLKIIILITKAAKQSLKKKGLHVAPWRRTEYVKAKWMSFHVRVDHNSDGEDKKEPVVDMLTKSVSSIVFGV
ncbi:hypothetical protein AALP_AA4G170300 [Arabis alpina]|uniref:Uncharacterized protein n=1 Tax=Arabis alpina TaxID=50452 RepID=A0A087H3T1_ARAAL|nr:hypothetical protein AALP_AA4G170300 [Arabis alpina]